jgi:alpha-galactosidase
MFKGLLGPSAAVSGDHVELAEHASTQGGEPARGTDFASTLGLGGVVSTRFVWPEAPKGSEDVLLTPEKEAHWKKWLALYREKRLFEGTFRNLYVYGFDVPEAYVIEKEGAFYYAFFTPEPDGVFEGDIELRGMARRRYRVQDYVSSRAFGTVEGPKARVTARFSGFLLLEAKER